MIGCWQTILPDRLWFLPEQGLAANHAVWQTAAGAVLFETARDPSSLLPQIESRGLKLVQVISTHGHFDHIGQADAWRDATAAPFAIGRGETAYLTTPMLNGSGMFTGVPQTYRPAERLLSEGDCWQLASDAWLSVWETPGHTPGGCCYRLWNVDPATAGAVPEALITGDTIIGTSIGRTDFPGGDPGVMDQTLARLKRELAALPADLPVISGHGPVFTVGEILTYNPWLRG